MYNPFKHTYRITEYSDPDGSYYEVDCGNFFCRETLCEDGNVRDDWDTIFDGINCKFSSVEDAKKAIELHLTNQTKSRLNKPTSKVIQYV